MTIERIIFYPYTLVLKRKKQPPEVYCEKGVLKNFAKLTGKHLFESLFFNKVACCRLPLY